MFGNINSNSTLQKGHLQERSKKEIDQKQESLILKNLFNQKTNSDQDNKKGHQKPQKGHAELIQREHTSSSKAEETPTNPAPKDFTRLLNII